MQGKTSKTEPSPIWPEAPRLCPERPFPRYRFTPGLNPHPTSHPEGHSKEHVPPNQWQENRIFLFGIDLYHQGYLWESHEAWEALWHLTAKEDGEGQFLQGLIQNSAAQLKVHLKQWSAARQLSHEAWERICQVFSSGICDIKGRFMGIDVSRLAEEMQAHYGVLWRGRDEVKGSPPHLSFCNASS